MDFHEFQSFLHLKENRRRNFTTYRLRFFSLLYRTYPKTSFVSKRALPDDRANKKTLYEITLTSFPSSVFNSFARGDTDRDLTPWEFSPIFLLDFRSPDLGF